MRILSFKLNGQILSKDRSCDFRNIIAGTEGYLTAKFGFSSDWAGCKAAASFWSDGGKEYPVLLKNGSCVIPSEALKGRYFEVSVTGKRRDGLIIPSSKVKISQKEG